MSFASCRNIKTESILSIISGEIHVTRKKGVGQTFLWDSDKVANRKVGKLTAPQDREFKITGTY